MMNKLSARVVELVDTRDLKSLGLAAVRVQVPPRVRKILVNILFDKDFFIL